MQYEITEFLPLEKGKVKITFDNGMQAVFYRRELHKFGIKEQEIVTEDVFQKLIEDILMPRVRKRALYLLERKDWTEKQLYDKLKQNEYPEICIEAAMDFVKQYHYVDDVRYALNYVRCHQGKKSRQKLKLDLLKRGVEKDVIENALDEEYVSDDREKILELLEKRHYTFENADSREQRKQYQFLLRKGFQSSDILRVMKAEI